MNLKILDIQEIVYGPLGGNGLANFRDFETPVASFDIDQSSWKSTLDLSLINYPFTKPRQLSISKTLLILVNLVGPYRHLTTSTISRFPYLQSKMGCRAWQASTIQLFLISAVVAL